MAVADDITRAVDSIEKLANNGVPIKLEHEVESGTMWQLILGLAAVAVVFVVLLGAKDIIVHNINKTG